MLRYKTSANRYDLNSGNINQALLEAEVADRTA